MRNSFVALCAGTLLTACGGGGGSGSFDSIEIVQSYASDGSGIAKSSNISSSGPNYNAAFIVSDASNAGKIADALYRVNNGLTDIVDGDVYDDGSYWGSLEGINSNGETIKLIAWGVTLGQDDYVSSNVIMVDDEYVSFATDGSIMTSAPTGKYTYTGSIEIYGGSAGDATETGTLKVIADFDNSSASLSGTTAKKFLIADELMISNTGEITGNGKVGIISTNSANAGVTAFLAGKAATGVHGVAAQSNDVPDGMGASFIGWR